MRDLTDEEAADLAGRIWRGNAMTRVSTFRDAPYYEVGYFRHTQDPFAGGWEDVRADGR